MTTRIDIVVPDHVERVVVQTQGYTSDGWKDNPPFEYGPGSHFLHIYDALRIICIAERPYALDATPQPITLNEAAHGHE